MSSTTVQPTTPAGTNPARADRRRPSRPAVLRRPSRAARIGAQLADSTLIQAVMAGALSFTHIRDVALHYGQDGWKSWLYPLSVDLFTVAAYRRLGADRAAGTAAPVAWCCLIMGLAASLTANIADAMMTAPAGADRTDVIASIIVGMWPALAFAGSTLLGHGEKPATAPPATDRRPATATPAANRPTDRPPTPIVRPSDQPPADNPTPIPVQPTGRYGDLGPRAATTGELPMAVWTAIGHPLYQAIQHNTGRRPTETALQQALADRTAELIANGDLPPAVGQPSTSTAKRIRSAIETDHPTLRPLRLAAATA